MPYICFLFSLILSVVCFAQPALISFPNDGKFELRKGKDVLIGDAKLVMQHDENFVLYDKYEPIWHSNTYYQNCGHFCRAEYRTDGRLVVFDPLPKKTFFESPTAGSTRLTLMAAGPNMYFTYNAPNDDLVFLNGTLRLFSGQTLKHRKLELAMEHNGDFVIKVDGEVRWTSNSSEVCQPRCHAIYQSDGNFVLSAVDGQTHTNPRDGYRPVYATNTMRSKKLTISTRPPYLKFDN